MNKAGAIAYGKQIGVRFHIYNSYGALVGGTKTREQAEAMKKRQERENGRCPFTGETIRYEIREIK